MSARLCSAALIALGLAVPTAFAGERPGGGAYTTTSSSQGCHRLMEEGPGAGRDWVEVPCRPGAPEPYIAGEADLRAAYDARHRAARNDVDLLGGPPPPAAYVQGEIRAADLPPPDYRPAYDYGAQGQMPILPAYEPNLGIEYARPSHGYGVQGSVGTQMPILPAYEPNLGITYARPTYDYGVQGYVQGRTDIRPAYEPNLGVIYARPGYDHGGQAHVQGGAAYGSGYVQRDYLAESYIDQGPPPPLVYRAPPAVYQDGRTYRHGGEARVESHGGYVAPPVTHGGIRGYAMRREYSSRSYERRSSESHGPHGSRYGPPPHGYEEPPPAYGYVQRYLTWPSKTP